jgi:hypothetical protein
MIVAATIEQASLTMNSERTSVEGAEQRRKSPRRSEIKTSDGRMISSCRRKEKKELPTRMRKEQI